MSSTQLKSIQKTFSFLENELLEELLENGSIHHFNAGETLVRKGQYFKSALIVINGLAKIYREDDDGNEFFIYYLEPGDACAQSMVCDSRQKTSEILAVAVKDTEILMVPLAKIDEWMMKYKSWNSFILSSYRQRFEELLITLDHVAFRNMDERLEFYLKRQAQKLGNNLQLTHQQIADDLNSSREVISRLLKNMEKNKRVILYRNGIEWIK
ncbi:MAG TPA: Crp/Fnr family transcriptional regulator [Chitinophagaceae bacterium]|nr:Crp/Fnr family transcriptional regulator [Chitinophagaceae bacterium]